MRTSRPDHDSLLKWRRRNRYYYGWLDRIYKFVVRPGSRVLHVGCECGDLLAAVRPAYGVGVDGNQKAIALAKKRFPHLNFIAVEPHELRLNEKFDYVLICNSLGDWQDIQLVLERIYPLTDEQTRIVITYYNYLWEWVLRMGSSLGIRRPRRHQNWLPPQDIANLLNLGNFDVIRSDSFVLLPKGIWLISAIFNYILSLLPGFPRFQYGQSGYSKAFREAPAGQGFIGIGDSAVQK